MIIGTAGHIDHGKTALVRALTGVDTDRLAEEKARGISIELGFAYLPVPGGATLGFIDVPGHERFIHTMLAGASGIDLALLVVAADDGVMPQTREHLAILDLLGIAQGIVALSKSDLADDARLAEVEAEIAAALAGTGLAGAPIRRVSAATGAGIDALRAALVAAAERFAGRRAEGRFRLAVDRCFVLKGVGTVVTGTVLSGSAALGDPVTVSPAGIAARIRSLHVQNRPAERAQAGDRAALNLAGEGIARDRIARGDVVLDPLLHAPTERIDASLTVLASEPKPIGQWMPVRCHTAAAEVGAHLVLLGEPIASGETGLVQLVLDRPVAAAVGDRFVLREAAARRTIGGGVLLELRAPTRRRRSPDRLARLAAGAAADAATALDRLLALPPHAVELGAFLRDRALGPEEGDRLAATLGLVAAGGSVMAAADFARLSARLAAALGAFHADNPDLPGIGLERLRAAAAPAMRAPVFRAMLQALARAGVVALDGAWVRDAGHEARLSAEDEAVWQECRAHLLGEGRFRPPRVRDLVPLVGVAEAELRLVLKRVARMGAAYEVAHDHFFPRPVVAEIAAILAELAQASPAGSFTAADLRDRLDNGRKVAIQILEFFDRHGVSVRRGDLRRLDARRLDLFAAPVEDPAPSGEEEKRPPVGRPDFKSGEGRQPVLGGFDSHSPPPARSRKASEVG